MSAPALCVDSESRIRQSCPYMKCHDRSSPSSPPSLTTRTLRPTSPVAQGGGDLGTRVAEHKLLGREHRLRRDLQPLGVVSGTLGGERRRWEGNPQPHA